LESSSVLDLKVTGGWHLKRGCPTNPQKSPEGETKPAIAGVSTTPEMSATRPPPNLNPRSIFLPGSIDNTAQILKLCENDNAESAE